MSLNVELLLKVKAHILENSLRIDMSDWCRTKPLRDDVPLPECGTVGCIYGWGKALTLNLRGEDLSKHICTRVWDDPLADVAKLFGCDRDIIGSLIFVGFWPKQFSNALDGEREGSPEYAQVVADRIDSFIAEYGPTPAALDTERSETNRD